MQQKGRISQSSSRHPEAPSRMSQSAYQPESHPQNAPILNPQAQSSHIQTSEIQGTHGQELQTPEEKAEEARRIRRLQLMMNVVMQVIQQDHSLAVEEASEMVADARRAALAMFPDKSLAFDLIFWPRLQRLMRERYRMQ
jgi:hypothetical protein